MAMSDDILESVKRIAEPVVTAEGMDLVEAEYGNERGGLTLRLYIDKEGGVTLDDCSNISGQVGQLIELNDLIMHPYTLEVSSPGLNRPLKKEEDFVKYEGKLVRLKVRNPVDGRKNFRGRLLGYEQGTVTIDVGDEIVSLPFNEIRKANLVYEF